MNPSGMPKGRANGASATPLYLSIASRREAGEVKDASQPGPPLGH
jgi:hypothetical protein